VVVVEEAATGAIPLAATHRFEVEMGEEMMSTGGVRIRGVRCWRCCSISLSVVVVLPDALTLCFSSRRRARSPSMRRIFWTRLERARSTLVIAGECDCDCV
jgi:anti-sigma-K factor RskA